MLVAMAFASGACGDDGGGGSADSCSFENCSGCCDGNECVTNTTTLFCGEDGRACNRCNTGDICSAGVCTAEADCSQCPNSGCCLDGTQCMEGNTRQACGSDGEACTVCSDTGDVCGETSRSCEATPCDSTTCSDGCCTAEGECKKVGAVGQNKDACGNDGDACEVCATSDISCTAGACVPAGSTCLDFCTDGCCMGETCVDLVMQDNASCGQANGNTAVNCAACTGDDNCAQGVCTAGPAWVVTISSATIADTDLDGEAWDFGFGAGVLPDAEIAGGLGGEDPDDFLVPFESNTLTPVWNYTAGSYSQADLVAKGLNLVFTDDDLAVDDPMGECTFTITQGDLDAGTKTQAVCGTKVTDLKIDFALVQ